MPRLLTNRRRGFHLRSKTLKSSDFILEILSGVGALTGALFLLIGSALFLNDVEPAAQWMYLFGTMLFLFVTTYDTAETIVELYVHRADVSRKLEWHWLAFTEEISATGLHMIGTATVFSGAVCFLPQIANIPAGASLFIAGNAMAGTGAIVNMFQTYHRTHSPMLKLLLSLIASQHLLGSVLFIVGNVPFLFSFESENDEDLLFQFSMWLFIAGSIPFATASATNFVRVTLAQSYHDSLRAETKLNKVEGNKDEASENTKDYFSSKDSKRDAELGKVIS